MEQHVKKRKVSARFSWVFLLAPYYYWIALIALGICNMRFFCAFGGFVYCMLISVFPEQHVLWWLLVIIHYLLTYFSIRAEDEPEIPIVEDVETVAGHEAGLKEIPVVKEIEVKNTEVDSLVKNDTEEIAFVVDFSKIETLRNESEVVRESLIVQENTEE